MIPSCEQRGHGDEDSEKNGMGFGVRQEIAWQGSGARGQGPGKTGGDAKRGKIAYHS